MEVKIMRKFIAPYLLIAALLLPAVAAGVGARPSSAPKVGEQAPDFTLPYATQEKIAMKPEEQMSLASL